MKTKKVHVLIRLPIKRKVEIDAYDTGVPGLVVHHPAKMNSDGTLSTWTGWTITHVSSGMRVIPFGEMDPLYTILTNTRKACLKAATIMGDYVDWDVDAETLAKVPFETRMTMQAKVITMLEET